MIYRNLHSKIGVKTKTLVVLSITPTLHTIGGVPEVHWDEQQLVLVDSSGDLLEVLHEAMVKWLPDGECVLEQLKSVDGLELWFNDKGLEAELAGLSDAEALRRLQAFVPTAELLQSVWPKMNQALLEALSEGEQACLAQITMSLQV